MQFSVFQISRQGGRKSNEDRMGYCYTRDSAVLMLADGLGGHPEGEVAAHLAVADRGQPCFKKWRSPNWPTWLIFWRTP